MPPKRSRNASSAPNAKRPKVLTERALVGDTWKVPITEDLLNGSDFLKDMMEYEEDVEVMEGDISKSYQTRIAVNRIVNLVELVEKAKAVDNCSPTVPIDDLRTLMARVRILHTAWNTAMEHNHVVNWLGPNLDMLKFVRNMAHETTLSGFFLKRNIQENQFSKYLEQCCILGKLDLVKWFGSRLPTFDDKLLWIACMHDHLDAAQFLATKSAQSVSPVNAYLGCTNIAEAGHLEPLKWWKTQTGRFFSHKLREMFKIALQCNHEHMVKWLFKQLKPYQRPTYEQAEFFAAACHGGNIDFILKQLPRVSTSSGLIVLVNNNNFALLETLVGRTSFTPVLQHAVDHKDTTLIQWCLDRKVAFEPKVIVRACANRGNVELLQHIIKDHPEELTEEAFVECTRAPTIDCAKWMLSVHKFDADARRRALFNACVTNQLDFAKWIAPSVVLPKSTTSILLTCVAKSGTPDMMAFVLDLVKGTGYVDEAFQITDGSEAVFEACRKNMFGNAIMIIDTLPVSTDMYGDRWAHCAAMNGNMELVVRVYPENPHKPSLFANACYGGNLDLCKYTWFDKMPHTQTDCCVVYAARNGHLNVIQWLDSQNNVIYRHDDDLAFRKAVEHGHADVAQWFYDKGCRKCFGIKRSSKARALIRKFGLAEV